MSNREAKRTAQEPNVLLSSNNIPGAGSNRATAVVTSVTPYTEHSKGNNCRTCNSVDDSRMVQCDNCDGWHHFACVGVSQEIEYHDWICAECDSLAQRNAFDAKTKLSKDLKSSKPNIAASKFNWKTHRKYQRQIENPPEDGSIVSGSSKGSIKALLTVQLQRVEAEETLMKEEIRRKKGLMEKKSVYSKKLPKSKQKRVQWICCIIVP